MSILNGKGSDKASENHAAKRWLGLFNPFHLLNSLSRKALNGTSLIRYDNFIEDKKIKKFNKHISNYTEFLCSRIVNLLGLPIGATNVQGESDEFQSRREVNEDKFELGLK